MILAHLTDIHLDFLVGYGSVEAVGSKLAGELPEGAIVIITGDIATGPTFPMLLPRFAKALGRRAFFVLGNHDAWETSIEAAKRSALKLSTRHPSVTYLPGAGIAGLTERTCLVGLDGWYDGRAGTGARASSMTLNDCRLVAELRGLHRARLAEVLEDRAQRDARRARELLGAALAAYEHVVIATHVPPFPEASVDEHGTRSDAHALPFYCNATLGMTLAALAATHPDRNITVLAGHCHGRADIAIAPNLRSITGAARYGSPSLAGLLDVE